MKLYLVVYCLDVSDDGRDVLVAHPTDYQPFATLVCAVNFADAAREAGAGGRIYELGDAVMGMTPGVLMETTQGVAEIKKGLAKHPRHKVR